MIICEINHPVVATGGAPWGDPCASACPGRALRACPGRALGTARAPSKGWAATLKPYSLTWLLEE